MSSKKLLAILGSPHKKGVTASMLDYTVAAAKISGWDTEYVHLYQEPIAYCTGCRTCLGTGECVQQDGLQKIAQSLKECDVVVLAAPVYWANVPAAVKNLFDRLLGTAMEETRTFPKPRLSNSQKYILLSACNTPFPFSWLCGQSRGAVRAMREFFQTAGMKCGGIYVDTNTGRKQELSEAAQKRIAGYLARVRS